MMRRKDNFTPDVLTLCGVTLNRSSYELGYQNKTLSLSGREFQVLDMLMQQPAVIIPTERLITHIWGWDASVDSAVVWVHISNIRKKAESIGAPLKIRFVRNSGYVLEIGV